MIQIETKMLRDGTWRSTVTVNGEWYAQADAPTQEQAGREAHHYAAQIEFDEEEGGNW